jgi:hypothetical protein
MPITVQYTSVGQTVARKACKSYDEKNCDESSQHLEDSFQSIAANPSTSSDEKVLANLGVLVGSHPMTPADAAEARLSVMQVMRDGVGGTLGDVVADACVSAYGNKELPAARAIMADGFGVMTSAAEIEPSDLSLAKLGTAVGNHEMADADACTARLSVMRSIAGDHPDDVSRAMAQVVVSAFPGKQWDSARLITLDGLAAVAAEPTASGDQKVLAQLGESFSAHSVNTVDSANASLSVLKDLSKPLVGSLTHAVTTASLEAFGQKQWISARYILQDGFQAVLANPAATPAEKDLATKGIQAGQTPDDVKAANARLGIMQQLHDL